MALQLTVTAPSGTEMIDAIHRVEDVCVVFNKHVRFLLKSYESSDASDAFEYHTLNAPYDATNSDIEQQAYTYAKSLSNFSDAVEVQL